MTIADTLDRRPLTETGEPTDHFTQRGGIACAGEHLHLDLHGCDPAALSDPARIEACLREGAVATGAHILFGHFHHFGPEQGVTGVLVLAESHVSIHSWPERGFAAVDVFVCGDCDPSAARTAIERGLGSTSAEATLHLRGTGVV